MHFFYIFSHSCGQADELLATPSTNDDSDDENNDDDGDKGHITIAG